MSTVIIKGNEGSLIELNFLQLKENDSDWLTGEVKTRIQGFSAHIPVNFYVPELLPFLSQLRVIQRTMKGTAELNLIEEQLSCIMSYDVSGTINIRGEVKNDSCRLSFKYTSDQTYLPNIIAHFEEALRSLNISTV